jgi:hypothetical protein
VPSFTGQLTNLAAAHPEAYASYADSCLRSSLLQPVDMMAAAALLEEGCKAALGCKVRKHCLDDAAAVSALVSALSSFAKRTAQFTKAAAGLQMPQRPSFPALGSGRFADIQDIAALAAASFPAFVPDLFESLQALAAVLMAVSAQASSSSLLLSSILGVLQSQLGSAASTASSSSSQARVASALLALVIIRGAVQIADAMETAGAQLLFKCQAVQPPYHGAQNLALDELDSYIAGRVGSTKSPLTGGDQRQQQTVLGQWQLWQQLVLRAVLSAVGVLKVLEIIPQLGGGSAKAEKWQAVDRFQAASGSSSSSSSEQVK